MENYCIEEEKRVSSLNKMPHVEAVEGRAVIDQLAVNDSWIKAAYFLVAEASSQMDASRRLNVPLLRRAEKLQIDVLDSIPHDGETARPIKPESVESLREFVTQENGGLIVMRHGRQFIEDEERKLLSGSWKKIRLMQLPFNDEDPADGQSLAEAAGIGLILKDISKSTGLPVSIWTSRNARAADIAAIISLANGAVIHVDDRLTCVNYPCDVPEEELDKKIGKENNGALVWRREIVNPVCGEGSFENISRNMEDIVKEYRSLPVITLCVTHTPQMNAADVYAGNVPVRVPELGFKVFGKNGSVQYPEAIFRS